MARKACPLIVLTASALLALALAACGGGNSKSDLVSEADSDCAENAVRLDRLQARPPRTFQEATDSLAKVVPLRKALDSKLDALEPPSDVKAEFDKYVSLRRQVTGLYAQEVAAGKRNDEAGFQKIDKQSAKLRDQQLAAAGQAGLQDCAGKAAPDDEKQVRDLVTRYVETSQPGLCNGELADANFVTVVFKTKQNCEKAQKGQQTDKVKIEKVVGTRSDAVVTAELVGGAHKGAKFTAILLKEDGKWKLYTQG